MIGGYKGADRDLFRGFLDEVKIGYYSDDLKHGTFY
jgi:hypothetical protein